MDKGGGGGGMRRVEEGEEDEEWLREWNDAQELKGIGD